MNRILLILLAGLCALSTACHDHPSGGGGGGDTPAEQFTGSVQTDSVTYEGIPASEAGILLPHQAAFMQVLDENETGILGDMKVTDFVGITTHINPSPAQGLAYIPYSYVDAGGTHLVEGKPAKGNYLPVYASFTVLPWSYTMQEVATTDTQGQLLPPRKNLLPGERQNWSIIRASNGSVATSGFGQGQFFVEIYRLLPNGAIDHLPRTVDQTFVGGSTIANFDISSQSGQYLLIGGVPHWNGSIIEEHATPIHGVRVINPFGDVGLEFDGYKQSQNEVIEFTPMKWPSNATVFTLTIRFTNLSSGESFSPQEILNLNEPYEWSPMISQHPLGLWEVELVGHMDVGFRTAKYWFWVQ